MDDHNRQDEEHKLIARYTSRLADTESSGVSPPSDLSDVANWVSVLKQSEISFCPGQVIPNRSINFDVNKQKRELIAQLEHRNR